MKKLLFTQLLFVFALASFAFAQPMMGGCESPYPGAPCPSFGGDPHSGHGPHGFHHGGRNMAGDPKQFGYCGDAPCVTLSTEQRTKYYAVAKEFGAKFQELNDQLFVKQQELDALKKAAQPDINAVRSVASEIVTLRAAKRTLKNQMDEQIAKEFGIKRPQSPIPGVDCPFGPRNAPPRHGMNHHGMHHHGADR